NQDAVLWFAGEVLPRLQTILGVRVPFPVVGQSPPPEILALGSGTIAIVPNAVDLVPFYEQARLFVAPTRFAAGIPLKVIHAAAHGLPVVCTSLLARQLGWSDGDDLLTADTAKDFAERCALLYSDGALWLHLR